MMLNQLFTSTAVSLFSLCVGFFYTVLKKQFGWLMLLRCSLISSCLLLSAFNFSQSARQMTHCGFMFPVANGAGGGSDFVTSDEVEKVMVTSENSQWAGLRFFYLAICSVVWLLASGIAEPAGEWGFLAACVGMRVFLGKIDRPPRGSLSIALW